MPGLLTHLSVALAGFVICQFIFKNWKYGVAFVFGHLVPDLIDFGIGAVVYRTLNPGEIMTKPLFAPLASLGHTPWHWIIFGIVIFSLIFSLFKFKKISKNKFVFFTLLLLVFLMGVSIHLALDKLIIETSYWI